MENVAEKQHGLLELLRIRLNPVIEDLGYELYDLEDLQYQGQRILRVSIDHEQGIQLEDCVRIDQMLQKLFDENDPIEEAYTLEVSSFSLLPLAAIPSLSIVIQKGQPVAGCRHPFLLPDAPVLH